MIRYFVDKIINYGVKTNCINCADINIYRYGYVVLIEVSLCVIMSIITAIITKKEMELIIFSTFFIPLRCFGGGFHTKKAQNCFILSLITVILICLSVDNEVIIKHRENLLLINLIMIFLIQKLLIIYRYTSKITSKTIVLFIFTFGIFLIFILFNLQRNVYAISIMMAELVWQTSLAIDWLFKQLKVKK